MDTFGRLQRRSLANGRSSGSDLSIKGFMGLIKEAFGFSGQLAFDFKQTSWYAAEGPGWEGAEPDGVCSEPLKLDRSSQCY